MSPSNSVQALRARQIDTHDKTWCDYMILWVHAAYSTTRTVRKPNANNNAHVLQAAHSHDIVVHATIAPSFTRPRDMPYVRCDVGFLFGSDTRSTDRRKCYPKMDFYNASNSQSSLQKPDPGFTALLGMKLLFALETREKTRQAADLVQPNRDLVCK